MTAKAQEAVSNFIAQSDSPTGGLRIAVESGGCSGLKYKMSIESECASEDTIVTLSAFSVFLDSESVRLLDGVTVDFVSSLAGSGFTFDNPQATAACNCGKSFSA